jgi:Mrp family chromosome partitioning ATPase/capsular polysaccharide biosynthesis protein
LRNNGTTGPTTLADYAGILWRRRYLVLAAVVGVPIVAVALSSLQTAQYRASTDVLIRTESVVSSITGVPDTSSGQDPQRLLDTQARLARVPSITNATLAAAHAKMSSDALLHSSSVSADPNADILTFSVTSSSADQAIRLANAYAAAYTRYRTELDRAPIRQALATAQTRIAKLQAAHATGSALYASLVAKEQQLQAIQALPVESAQVVDPAETAPKVKPRPVFDAALGLIVGVLLGVAAALVLEAVEKRPRSSEDLQHQLGLRVLGRIPATAEGGQGLVALSHPGSVDAEVYRLLRLNFERAAAEVGGRVFVVTSAMEGEGKSTVAANLAVALARAGRSTIIADLDPLRPVLRERFGLPPGPGVIEVVTGRASLEGALTPFALPTLDSPEKRFVGPDGRLAPVNWQRGDVRELGQASWRPADVGDDGSLRVLMSNPASVELSDHVVATKLEGLLEQLRRAADVVILDAAPLSTSVGMGVGQFADGVIVVSNLQVMRRPIVEQLGETLAEVSTPKLGVVLTGVSVDATFTYGYYTSATEHPPTELPVAERPNPAGVQGRWSSAS